MYISLEKQIGRSLVIYEINTHNLCFLHCVLNVSLFFIHNMHDPEYIQKLEDSFIRIKYLNNVLKRKEAAEKIRDNIFLGLVLFTIGHKNLSVFKFVFSIFDIAISVEMLSCFIFSLLSPTINKYCPYL